MKLSLLSVLTLTLAPLVFSQDAKPAPTAFADVLKAVPASEKQVPLFNGKDLTGWDGMPGIWSVEDGVIKGTNDKPLASSTYLFTKDNYRSFRLLLEVKQTISPQHSSMHSAVCVLGEKFADKGENTFGFKGPLLMFCQDWGIWDAYRRNRTVPPGHNGTLVNPTERKGDWNLIEVLVIGDRIRFAANGAQVFDFTDKPEMLKDSPIGLQVHANGKPQEWRFRGLVLTPNPEDRLVTVK